MAPATGAGFAIDVLVAAFAEPYGKRYVAAMLAERFWEIIDEASTPEALGAILDTLDADDLIGFERRWIAADVLAYRWDLWGAAYIFGGGCGDDSFDYFRAYLISRGRTIYELGISDADALATVDLEKGHAWERWMYPTMAAVQRRTGEYAPASPPEGPGFAASSPVGEPWEEEDLALRFPQMTARYG